MNKRVVFPIVGVVGLILFLAVGLAVAEEIITRHGIYWTDPNWQQTWVKIESEEPITTAFTGTLQVRRPGSGEVIFSQDFDTSCTPTEDDPGVGRCGSLEHTIDTDNFRPEDLELWSRACWTVTGYAEPLCSIYVPNGCDLTGIGCTTILSGTEITVPDACRTAIEQCGTVQDEQGYWRIRTFRGTKRYGICIPGLIIQEE